MTHDSRLRVQGRAFAHIAQFLPELTALRRDLHAHPELGFEERYTASRVAEFRRGADQPANPFPNDACWPAAGFPLVSVYAPAAIPAAIPFETIQTFRPKRPWTLNYLIPK